MNILSRGYVETVLHQFSTGQMGKETAIRSLLEMSQNPDFKEIWETLIIHIALLELGKRHPDALSAFMNHWRQEVCAWQRRLQRFWNKPKASFRNAVQRDFYNARDGLLRDDAVNLVLNLDLHLEQVSLPNESEWQEIVTQLQFEEKTLSWFLEYAIEPVQRLRSNRSGDQETSTGLIPLPPRATCDCANIFGNKLNRSTVT